MWQPGAAMPYHHMGAYSPPGHIPGDLFQKRQLMTTQWWVGLISSFLASAVEVVEAVTIVLAAGVTRGWRSTWIGVVSAALTLGLLVALLGPALQVLIPIDALRIVIGTLLLIFGLQWIRKAI